MSVHAQRNSFTKFHYSYIPEVKGLYATLTTLVLVQNTYTVVAIEIYEHTAVQTIYDSGRLRP